MNDPFKRYLGYILKPTKSTLILFSFILISIFAAWFGLKKVEVSTRNHTINSIKSVLYTTHETITETWAKIRFESVNHLAKQNQVISNTKILLEYDKPEKHQGKHVAANSLKEMIETDIAFLDAEEFFLISANGLNLASSQNQNMGDTNQVYQKFSDRFSRVFKGNPEFVPPTNSRLTLTNENGKLIEEYPAMFIMVPVYDNKKVIAVLGIGFNPFKEFSIIAKMGRVGISGETYMLDKHGKLLTQSRFENELYNTPLLKEGETSILNIEIRDPEVNLVKGELTNIPRSEQPLTYMASQIAREKSGFSIKGYNDYRGVKVIGAWHWDSKLGIGFATEVNETEALEPYIKAKNVIVGLLSFILVLSVIIFIFIQEISYKALVKNTEQEDYLNAILNNAMVPIVTTDSSANITSINYSGINTFGYALNELLGKNINTIVKDNLFVKELSKKTDHFNWPEIEEFGVHEYTVCTKDGTELIVKLAFASVEVNSNLIYIFTINNITNEKKAEKILKERQQEVEKTNSELLNARRAALSILEDMSTEKERTKKALSELQKSTEEINKLSQAIEQSSSTVLITDKDGSIVYVNKAFTDVTGYQNSEAIGKNPNMLKSGKTKNNIYVNLWKTILSGKTWRGEFLNKRKNGETYWDYASISPILNDANEIINFVSVQEDITQRKILEEELKNAKEQAESANHAKSAFLANMSHEIRTPMNAIIGFSEILSKKINDPSLIGYLNSIKSSGKTLLKLINDVLDISKIESGKLEIRKEPVSLKVIVEELKSMFNVKIKEKGLLLKITHLDTIPDHLELDELRIRQVLINLISNAVKFTESGYIELLFNSRNNNNGFINLVISVKDTGIGIADKDRETILDAFQQANNQDTRKYGGTGLGLSISLKIIELLGGKLTIQSKIDEGSTFNINIPNIKISENIPELSTHRFEIENIAFTETLLLVVDDIKENRDIVKGYLEGANIKVIEAENGKQAIKAATEFTPDIILMDMRMPEMDGNRSSEIIKSKENISHIPIIALTASAYMKTKEELKHFDGYLRKPLQINDFINELIRFIPYKEIGHTPSKKQDADENAQIDIPENPKEVIKKLEMIRKEKWVLLEKRQALKDVKNFTSQLSLISNEYKLTFLNNYVDKLEKATASFDIETIKNLVLQYPGYIDTLKAATNNE